MELGPKKWDLDKKNGIWHSIGTVNAARGIEPLTVPHCAADKGSPDGSQRYTKAW